jgi:hypothetical protein
MDNFQPIKVFDWTDDEKQAFVDDWADLHPAKPYFPNRIREYLLDNEESYFFDNDLDCLDRGEIWINEPRVGETFNEYLYRLLTPHMDQVMDAVEELEEAETLRRTLDKASRDNYPTKDLERLVKSSEEFAFGEFQHLFDFLRYESEVAYV